MNTLDVHGKLIRVGCVVRCVRQSNDYVSEMGKHYAVLAILNGIHIRPNDVAWSSQSIGDRPVSFCFNKNLLILDRSGFLHNPELFEIISEPEETLTNVLEKLREEAMDRRKVDREECLRQLREGFVDEIEEALTHLDSLKRDLNFRKL